MNSWWEMISFPSSAESGTSLSAWSRALLRRRFRVLSFRGTGNIFSRLFLDFFGALYKEKAVPCREIGAVRHSRMTTLAAKKHEVLYYHHPSVSVSGSGGIYCTVSICQIYKDIEPSCLRAVQDDGLSRALSGSCGNSCQLCHNTLDCWRRGPGHC